MFSSSWDWESRFRVSPVIPCVALNFQDTARYNERSNFVPEGNAILADEKTYKAEYLGSGTFQISKPKRKKHKLRQTRLRNPGRGSRK
jgi:hypothetical protein